MSKIKKALKKPRVFFADMLVKHSEHHLMPEKVLDHKVVSQFIEKYRSKDKVFISSTNPNERFNLNFLEEYKVVLCSGEGLSAGMAHIELWLPSFIHANINFIVLVRHAVLYEVLLHKYPDLSIVFCKRPIDVENFFSRNTSIRTVFYPSSTGNNIHLVRFEKLKHIFIGHGDSDKASSANKALRLYDEIWTAGQAHIDRFKNSPFDTNHIKFNIIGRPNAYKYLKSAQNFWSSENINFLYLPTWEGFMEEANYSSLHFSTNIIALLREFTEHQVSVKFHPLTGNRDKYLSKIDLNLVRYANKYQINVNNYTKDICLDTVINNYNVFICDISAVITDCLALDHPIFVYIPLDKEINIAQSEMQYKDYCYTFSNVEELSKKLKQVLSGDDYLKDNRRKALDYLLNYDATLGQKFIAELRKLNK